jgi:formylmethanofuran dehydrogenase subunit B
MEMTERVIDDVACTVCACVCDDISITVRNGEIINAERACALAEPWFLGSWATTGPAVHVRGQAAEFDIAIREAAEILRDARAPLFYGLSKSSTEGQRAAVALADRLGATIDTTASEGHAPSILAMQQVGESTCSLGEIRNRADLVIYWGADPLVSHPRHMERYSMDATGLFIPRGRADRSLVVVDSHRSTTAEQADWYLHVEEGRDFEALWTLRGLLKGIEPEPGHSVGASLEDLKRLAERMKTCRCGVIFFGYGVARAPLGHRNVEALLRLVIDLNQFTRFHARRLRVVGDVSGADSVLCWQTGYPFSVNLSRGYPRYNPGEYSAGDLLENREADVLVLIGTSRVTSFPPAAQAHIASIRTIVLERANAELPFTPTVHFATATYGIHRPGTAYRMDEIPIRLRPLLDSPLPSDGDVLRAIHSAL